MLTLPEEVILLVLDEETGALLPIPATHARFRARWGRADGVGAAGPR